MNADTAFQIVRYVLLFGGGLIVGRGWITNVQLELIVGFVLTVLPAAWGLYVKWNTTPVLDVVIAARDLPTVSGATGAKLPEPSKIAA
jgi:hypothetical protein